MDEKGRINLGKEARERYGGSFFIVKLSGEILLIPKPKDPVAEMKKWGKELEIDKMMPRDIRRMAEEEANKEVEERIRRRHKEDQ